MAEGGVTESSSSGSDYESCHSDIESSSSKSVYDCEYGLAFDELREEEVQEGQARKGQHKDKTNAFCDNCFVNSLDVITKIVALSLCFVCEKYFCDKCLKGHTIHKSHNIINLVSEKSEKETRRRDFLGEMRKERKREEKIERENVSMVDRVNVKYGLDRNNCYITGICGLGNTRWVVFDYLNSCIKIFNVGTNLLQRYIRLGSKPWDITEVKVKSKSSGQVANTTGDPSVTNQTEPLLLAVTSPRQHLILIIDVTHSPAVITKTIKTEKRCFSIDSRGGNLVTLCRDKLPDGDRRWFILVITTDGTIIQTINPDLHLDSHWPHLAVSSGRFYITDPANNRVLCLDNEGNEVYHKTIEGSDPHGIIVDPDTGLVYVCSTVHHKVYRLNASLENLEILFDFESVNSKWPHALCLHGDRLYVSHDPWSTHADFVSVVRVL